MSDETRTPNANTVRSVFVRAHPFSASTSYEDRRAEFDRFIAKVKADALREAAEGFRHCKDYGYRATRMRATEDYLNDKADRIEGEA